MLDGTYRSTSEEKAVKDKTKRYAELAKELHAELVTFYINVHGGWGQQSKKFVKEMVKANIASLSGIQDHELFYRVTMEIAIAVQRRNAYAADACFMAAFDSDNLVYSDVPLMNLVVQRPAAPAKRHQAGRMRVTFVR